MQTQVLGQSAQLTIDDDRKNGSAAQSTELRFRASGLKFSFDRKKNFCSRTVMVSMLLRPIQQMRTSHRSIRTIHSRTMANVYDASSCLLLRFDRQGCTA